MSEQASKNPDKTIVERRVAHAGDKSRLAVRNLRAGLGSKASSNPQYSTGFEPDILRRHAKTIRSTWLASIFVFAIAAAVCQMILPPTMVAGWFVIAVLVVLGGYKLAQIYLKSAPEEAGFPALGTALYPATCDIRFSLGVPVHRSSGV